MRGRRVAGVRYRYCVETAVGEGPLKYAPWLGGEFRWRLGMRPLDLDDWMQLGDDYAPQMATKAAARADNPGTVFHSKPEALPACNEVLDLLTAHLIRLWPADFARADREICNHRTGERIGSDVHPLDAAGRLVQEDLIVLIADRCDHHNDLGQLVVGAGSVCLPNRWDLSSKLGRTLVEVHEPVSRLNEQVGDPIDKFFARLTPDKSFWRVGWGVIDTPELYQPLDGTAPDDPARGADHSTEVRADDLYVRVERETVRRLPVTGGVLFTIRTYLTKASRVRAEAPVDGDRLAEAIAELPGDVRGYKQLDVCAPALEDLFAGPRPTTTEKTQADQEL